LGRARFRKPAQIFGLFLLVGSRRPTSGWVEPDRNGSKGNPLFTSMPDIYIIINYINYCQTEVDAYQFTLPFAF
jgi:hypothetical protein